MENSTLTTFFGKLTQCPVTNDAHHNHHKTDLSISSYYYIQYLERKVNILENIVNTSNQIAEINQTIMSNHDQTVHSQVQVSDVGIQADLKPLHHSQAKSVSLQTDIQISPRLFYEPASPQTDVEYDGTYDDPESFMVIDEEGRIEAPDSLLENGKNQLDSDRSSENVWCENYYQTLAVSSISSASLIGCYDTCSDDSETNSSPPMPVELIDDRPFAKFCIKTLLRELDFTHNFQNRKAIYFGQFPYHYSGGKHDARSISTGSYLGSICSYMDVLFPNYEYNSVLINFYEDGQDCMPLHSDTEDCIEDESYIVTVSLGATRTLMFNEMSTGQDVMSTDLHHGDVSIMSRHSQDYYKHEILPNPSCSDSRISLTFRLIKPQIPQRHSGTPHKMGYFHDDLSEANSSECGYVPYSEHKDQSERFSQQSIDSLFISSSMFRGLDEAKLSSEDQKAKVFFYPGANSTQMMRRLMDDEGFKTIDKKSVKNIFLLTGTNYVDDVSSGVLPTHVAIKGINNICFKLWDMCINAKLSVTNLLPRVDRRKNATINILNKAIKEMCRMHGHSFVDTESKVKLFSNNGHRKSAFFRQGFDDVHLNKSGISRLGKHLKYIAHNNLID